MKLAFVRNGDLYAIRRALSSSTSRNMLTADQVSRTKKANKYLRVAFRLYSANLKAHPVE